jgi:hypothetical protein
LAEFTLKEGDATADYLTDDLSAVNLTVYPFMALSLRHAGHRADFEKNEVIGPRLAVWMDRMKRLSIVERTWRSLEMSAPA